MSKKLIVIVLLAFNGILFGGVLLLAAFLNATTIKQMVTDNFRASTGLTLNIQGAAEVKVFPLPHVIIHDLYVPNVPTAAAPFLLTVNTLDVHPSIPLMLTGRLAVSSVEATKVEVNLERLKDGQMNWSAVIADSSARTVPPAASSGLADWFALKITGGALHYTDTPLAKTSDVKDIGLLLTANARKDQSSLDLRFSYTNRPFVVSGYVGNLSQLLSGAIPMSLNIGSGKSTLSYEGNTGIKQNTVLLNGSLALATDDMTPWLAMLFGDEDETTDSTAHYAPLPLEIKSTVTSNGETVSLPDIILDGAVVKGRAQLTFMASKRHADVKASLDTLDVETVSKSRLIHMRIPGMEPVHDEFGAEITPESAFSLGATIEVADALYNDRHIKDTHFDFDFANAEMTINRASALLPGESRLEFTGIGKKNDQGFTLEGQTELAGNDFTQMVTVFDPSGMTLPAEDFKRFRMKANAVLSAREARFSEFAARIENMALVGGIIVNFEHRTRLQAALRMGGINFDHLISLWGLKEWLSTFGNENLNQTNKDTALSRWLKHLDWDIGVNAALEPYVLEGKQHDKGGFELVATQGKLALNNLQFTYGGSQIAANASLNVTDAMPAVTLEMATDTMDIGAVLPGLLPAKSGAATGDRWAHNEFNLHWLETLTAKFHLRFGHFKYGTFEATSADVQGGIDNRTLNIDSLTATILDANVVSHVILTGGKIPALAVAGNIEGLDASKLATYFPLMSAISGQCNIRLNLSTSGVDMYSWVSNLGGQMGIAGRNIIVHGFNLPGVMQAVAYVRTVADLLYAVKRAFPGGDTNFSAASGQWTMTNGVLKTADMQLANEQSYAQLSAKVDFVNWNVTSRIVFTLKALDPVNPPTMALGIAGSLDAPEKSLDTHTLEQYVTRQTSEKMLNQ